MGILYSFFLQLTTVQKKFYLSTLMKVLSKTIS